MDNKKLTRASDVEKREEKILHFKFLSLLTEYHHLLYKQNTNNNCSFGSPFHFSHDDLYNNYITAM